MSAPLRDSQFANRHSPRQTSATENNRCRIVLTGGPGGGKTTAADLFHREIGDRVVIVPEAATLLFSGGFPRASTPLAVHAGQRAIYHVQRNLEGAQTALFPGASFCATVAPWMGLPIGLTKRPISPKPQRSAGWAS